jgi:hypothetical protein
MREKAGKEGLSAKSVIAAPKIVAVLKARSREILRKTAVRPLLYRVVQTVCIFTAGSRELLGSRAVGKTWGTAFKKRCPFFLARGWLAPGVVGT